MQGNNPYGPPQQGYPPPQQGYPAYPPQPYGYPPQANFGSNEEGRNALLMAIGGLFCFGIILGPLAYRKAMGLHGGVAMAARIIAVFDIVLWTIGIIARIAMIGGGHHY